MTARRVLVVDNHDSFVHTLVGYLRELGAVTTMIEADAVIDAAHAIAGFDGVLVAPGPGTPYEAGASVEVVHAAAAARMPLLGVCLGHQAIAVAFGGTVGHAPEPMHGVVGEVTHGGVGVFAGLPHPLRATRYHSLAVEASSLPAELVVTARATSGVVMGLAHRELPIEGVQFHPESVLTEGGYRLLANWLTRAGVAEAIRLSADLQPRRG